MSSQSSRLLKFLKNKWFIAAAVVVVGVAAYLLTRGGAKSTIESAVAVMGDVVEKVSVTGKVMPVGKADLAFEKGGVVTRIAVTVGDHVKKGDLIASLNSADDAAALSGAQAQLAELERGLRPEEFATDAAAVNNASTTLSNARIDAVNAVRDGYIKAQSSVVNYADIFFNNGQSANPTINIRVGSSVMEIKVNNERVAVSDILTAWKNDNDTASLANPSALLVRAENYVATIKNFMSDLSAIVNDLNAGNAGISQAMINADVMAMNTGLSTLNQAVTSVSSADTALRSASSSFDQASNQFALEKAGSSSQTIAVQAAKVLQAQAQLAKDRIIAPIDGIVTTAAPDAGEFVSAGAVVFAIQSEGAFKIEAYVPEADIAKIVETNSAAVTLDAYGSDVIFPASVTMIDPAETVLEGVPTYKVTLMFTVPDPRVRSGMTANTDILTHQADGVLMVPSRAVIDESGAKSVRLLNADGKTFTSVPVTTGLKGSDGTIQIISGLNAGDRVVTYVK